MENSGYALHKVGSTQISVHVVDGPFGSDLKSDEYQTTGVPLLRVSNCRTGAIVADHDLVYISPEKHAELIRSEVMPGDVLLTKAGHILGYTAVFPDILQRGNITSHLASIRPSHEIEPAYLAEFLASPIGIAQIYRWGNKSTRPELNTNEVRGLVVVLPTLTRQRELMKVMGLAREARRTKLAEADALLSLLDVYLLDLLGLAPPPADTRRSYAIRLCAVSTTRFDPDYFHPERILTVRGMQQVAGRLRCAPLQQLVEFRRDQLATPGDNYLSLAHVQGHTGELVPADDSAAGACFLFEKEDVLFGRLRPYLNKVHCAERGGCCSPEFHVMRARPGSDLLPDYLATVLRSSLILAQTRHMMTGNTHPRLSHEDVVNLVIPIPSATMQTTIAAEVRRRREQARALRIQAEAGWADAKRWFEEQLLGPSP